MKNSNPKLLIIQEKIDKLSLDEDDKQDLWLAYLQDPDVNFSNTLDNIKFNKLIQEKISANIVACFYSINHDYTHEALDAFTEFERSILILLMVGLSMEQISRYKMIGMLRLQQMLNNISTHPIWEELHAKEKTKYRREIWPDG